MARHRSIAKHSYLPGKDRGRNRAKAHVNYIQFRAGRGPEREERSFFNGLRDDVQNREIKQAINRQNPKGTICHKVILSPGVEDADVKEYTREVMAELCSKKGQDLEWYAVVHENTDNPHAHIVIMGKDENGRPVRLDKKDYELIKEVGDRYLERNKLLNREKDQDKDKDKDELDRGQTNTGRFFDALKAAASEFKRVFDPPKNGDEKDKNLVRETEYQKRRREKEEEREAEQKALGADLDLDKKLQIQQKNEERQKADKEKAWTEYCKPVDVSYPLPDGSEFTYSYNRKNSLESLQDLATAYKSKEQATTASLSEDDFKRVNAWIREKQREEALLSERAAKLNEITVALDHENNLTVTEDSPFDDLLHLTHLNARGAIYLDPAEDRALDKWFSRKELQEPIMVELDESNEIVYYDREDSRQVLSTLKEEYDRGEAILTEQEATRLQTWITEKDKDRDRQTEEPLKEITIHIADETFTVAKDDDLDRLELMDRFYRDGETGLSQYQFKILRAWIVERERENAQKAHEKAEEHRIQAEKEQERRELEKPIFSYDPEHDEQSKYSRVSELSDLKGLERAWQEGALDLKDKEVARLRSWIFDKEEEEYNKPIEVPLSDAERQHRDEAAEFQRRREQQDKRKEYEKPIEIFDPEERETYQYSMESSLDELYSLTAGFEDGTNRWPSSEIDAKDADKLLHWIEEKEKDRDSQPLRYVDRSADESLPTVGKQSVVREVNKTDSLSKLKELDQALDRRDLSGEGPSMHAQDRVLLQIWIADKEKNEIERADKVITKDESSLEQLRELRDEKNANIEKLDKWIDDKSIEYFEDSEGRHVQVSRDADLKTLKGLHERVEDWTEGQIRIDRENLDKLEASIAEKEYNKPIEVFSWDEAAGDGETFLFDKTDSLSTLQSMEQMYRDKKDDPQLKPADHEKLKAWIADKEREQAIEKDKEISISFFEFGEDTNTTISKESGLKDLKGLAEGIESGEIILHADDEEKLRAWINEKEHERDTKPLKYAERPEDRVLVGDEKEPIEREISKDDKLERLQELERGLSEEDGPTMHEEDREILREWIEDKEGKEVERNEATYTKDNDIKDLDQVREAEIEEREKLDQWIAEREREDERQRQEQERVRDEEKELLTRDEKLEKLKERERIAAEDKEKRGGLSKDEYEKLKQWIQDKEANEIEYGGKTFTKDTPLTELKEFRDELLNSRYEKWIDKEQFSKLCSWIRDGEQEERDARDIAQLEKEADYAGRAPDADVKRERELKDRDSRSKDRPDKDEIQHGDQSFNENSPLSDLEKFKEELDNARYENRIPREDYKKLCTWINNQYRNKDREKPFDKQKNDGRYGQRMSQRGDRRRDNRDYVSKYKPTALEKRMQQELRHDRAERLKARLKEKAMKKEYLEKSEHEAMWARLETDGPVLRFVNLVRKGALEVKKHREKELEKKERQKDLPYPDPKTHLEELANKKYLDDLAKLQPGEKTGKKEDKPKTPDKEIKDLNLKVVLPFPDPKSHLEELANKAAIDRARMEKEQHEKEVKELTEKQLAKLKEFEKNQEQQRAKELAKLKEKEEKNKLKDRKAQGKDEKPKDKPKTKSKHKDKDKQKDDDDRGGR